MDNKIIVHSLVKWIESHLETPLSVGDVALKSGYTRWHMQRMFKAVTGQSVATYVRERQLTKAAIALRITTISILDISLLYQFDSQQSFTRAFKKQFGCTPGRYRRAQEWDALGIKEPIMLDDTGLPEESFVEIEEISLKACSRKYRSTLNSFHDSRREVRTKVWRVLCDNALFLPSIVYGFNKVLPGEQLLDEQILFYGVGIKTDQNIASLSEYEDIVLEKGMYVQFSYQGERDKFQDFILKVYRSCLPKLGLIRRKGMDIERFHLNAGSATGVLPTNIHCDYLIPVRRD